MCLWPTRGEVYCSTIWDSVSDLTDRFMPYDKSQTPTHAAGLQCARSSSYISGRCPIASAVHTLHERLATGWAFQGCAQDFHCGGGGKNEGPKAENGGGLLRAAPQQPLSTSQGVCRGSDVSSLRRRRIIIYSPNLHAKFHLNRLREWEFGHKIPKFFTFW